MDRTKKYYEFRRRLFEIFGRIPRCLTFEFFNGFCTKSQPDKVLWHLKEFGFITNLQCHEIYGICHAPSVIQDIRERLKTEGAKFKIENVEKTGTGFFGQPTNWVEYTLVPTDEFENKLKKIA